MNSPGEKKELILLGAGGHAKVILATALAAGWDCSGLYDDDPGKWGERILGRPVLGGLPSPEQMQGQWVVAAVGSNSFREELAARYVTASWATIIHPSSQVHASVLIGVGSVVFAGSVIQPDSILGRHVIVNTGATVDHDCVLEDFVHIAPGTHLAGGVRLGSRAFLGIGASVIPGVMVGPGCVIGAGAAVVTDIPANTKAVGVPARPIRRSS